MRRRIRKQEAVVAWQRHRQLRIVSGWDGKTKREICCGMKRKRRRWIECVVGADDSDVVVVVVIVVVFVLVLVPYRADDGFAARTRREIEAASVHVAMP